MQKYIAIVIIIFSCLLSSGCTTLADAQSAKGAGRSKTYDKPYDVVWVAVVETVRSSGLSIVSENKDKGSILAQGATSAFSWGENVAIFVEDAVGHVTRVEVVNKRALATNITAPDWETRIFEALDKRL